MTIPALLHSPLPHEHRQGANEARRSYLEQVIEHAAHLLPAQGPITVFIHHNTLHAFENMPFAAAVAKAAQTFGCQPYLPEERYREELRCGRIRCSDLETILHEDLGEGASDIVLGGTTRFELRLAMLQYPLQLGPTAELLWFVAETDALRRVRSDVSAVVRGTLIAETRHWTMRDLRGGKEAGRNGNASAARRGVSARLSELLAHWDEAALEGWSEEEWEAFTLQLLWRVCGDGVAAVPDLRPIHFAPVRHRNLLLQATGVDVDLLVHEVLIPFCGAFLDQGLSRFTLPRRDQGFYHSFLALYRLPGGSPDQWRRRLAIEMDCLEKQKIDPLTSIQESLHHLGVSEKEWDDFLSAVLLALPGWGGIIRFLEEHPDRVVHPIPPGSLTEFLAIRLVLERLALEQTARQTLGFSGPLHALRRELLQRCEQSSGRGIERRAFLVFQLAQLLGWTPDELHRLDHSQWCVLVKEIESFSTIERQRIFHLAYERRFRVRTLDALALHNRASRQEPRSARFQVMFCIDEREESMRRHVEELAPDAVTFGIAGFFCVDMYYRGAGDAHFVPLCPIVIQPKHWVSERVDDGLEREHARSIKRRRALGMVSHQVHLGSRTFALGAILSAAVGVLATIPLIARTLFPRLTARIRRKFIQFVHPPRQTQLHLEQNEADDDDRPGFTLDEMIDVAERVLRDTGLTSGFARLVLTLGHGSTSMNNPHESAYDCGACGGSRGGPNGRAIAQMLNDPRVREGLQRRGLTVPPWTVFVGGMHNTSNDAITFYDLDELPQSHREEFQDVRAILERAADRNAHERCRRFESAPLTLPFAAARQHVEGRAEDLAQARPELGHATNAICVVGRRSRTRGLFLDRRAFLCSYDPTQEAAGTILTRILQAVVPVCAGINLEYYFSRVDNTVFGCGTKLPHNIASLLGVMNGSTSDLRTGLPWQMVEIHEPVRLLFVIETSVSVMREILDRNPGIAQLVRHDWIQLALLDPDSPTIRVYRNNAFHEYQPQADHLPRAASSVDWYRGWRDHLEFAQIDP